MVNGKEAMRSEAYDPDRASVTVAMRRAGSAPATTNRSCGRSRELSLATSVELTVSDTGSAGPPDVGPAMRGPAGGGQQGPGSGRALHPSHTRHLAGLPAQNGAALQSPTPPDTFLRGRRRATGMPRRWPDVRATERPLQLVASCAATRSCRYTKNGARLEGRRPAVKPVDVRSAISSDASRHTPRAPLRAS